MGATTVFAASKPNGNVQELVNAYLADARKNDPSVKGFSAEDGKKFFNQKRVHSIKKVEMSCVNCHTTNPMQPGKTPVGKVIEPLAPSANKERFTDTKKIEKWFKRNCEGVLQRECTPKEKGDFITYLFSL
ncbi:DUF1924 domain-containing protein [bacterium]|nr:MAG: DUF1924 domain-containing protein [bacterium]